MRREYWYGVALGALFLCAVVYKVIHSGPKIPVCPDLDTVIKRAKQEGKMKCQQALDACVGIYVLPEVEHD